MTTVAVGQGPWGVPPTALAAVEERARVVLRTGWRPGYADGPSSRELAAVISERAPTQA